MTEQLDTPAAGEPPPLLSRMTWDGPKAPIIKALAEARKHFKDLSAVGKMGFEDKRGNKRVHEYAPLDVVIEALEPGWLAVGLMVMQHCDGDFQHTMLGIGESTLTLSTVCPTWNSCQDLGGVETYLRRYHLKSIFCVADTEDDDGATAPNGRGEPMGRKQPSAPKASGPNVPKEVIDEVFAAGKEKGLGRQEFYARAKSVCGKDWLEFTEGDAKKLLADLVMK